MKYALSCLMVLLSCGSALAGDLFIVAAVNGGMPKKEKVISLKRGEKLQLHAVRKTAKGYIGTVPAFEEKGRVRNVSMQGYRHPGWLRIEPVVGEYNNLRNGGSIVPIHYRAKEATSGDALSFPAEGEEKSFGTLYFAVRVAGVTGEEFEETLPLHEKYPFQVVQVVYRADDTYLGYLTELFGTPFVIAPKITNGGFHQVESRMGCDCASFAVYGKRRQGYRVTYDGPRGIYRYLEELVSGPLYHQPYGETEAYVEEDGKAISTEKIQPGDIIHFGEQVSVFFRDAGIPGVLDRDDELMQCYGSTPVVTTFAKSGFYGKPVRVFRWRESGELQSLNSINRHMLTKSQ